LVASARERGRDGGPTSGTSILSKLAPARPSSISTLVDFSTAARIGGLVARQDPMEHRFGRWRLEEDFAELVPIAEERVFELTGLETPGPARVRVVGREEWVEANTRSFERLLTPAAARIGERVLSSPMLPLSRQASAVQLGFVLGWLSARVLGQYDLLVLEDDHKDDQDVVIFVGPNIVQLERRYGFAPREFRLWLALHELAHRAQFTGVPWLRTHFLGLVERVVGEIEPDPVVLLEAAGRFVRSLRSGETPLANAGLVGLLATPDQLEALRAVQALMSVLEGHGDVVMERAAVAEVPSAERFARTLALRRRSNGLGRLLGSVLGLDAKLRQYESGERFLRAIEARRGAAALQHLWASPTNLPSLDELAAPEQWLARVGLGDGPSSLDGEH